MSDNKKEPVIRSEERKVSGWGAGKQYDISMINVEITSESLAGLTTTVTCMSLTENIDKVRAEEGKNKAAREKDF